VLLLDEVIGAGDASFSFKARDRIKELVTNAKIMVLATHDLSAVRTLCNRVIHIQNGNIAFDGGVEQGIHDYQSVLVSRSKQCQE
jgi:lipopolysaccharide transport system ATP-binding protein